MTALRWHLRPGGHREPSEGETVDETWLRDLDRPLGQT
jgi:hypothetical protein